MLGALMLEFRKFIFALLHAFYPRTLCEIDCSFVWSPTFCKHPLKQKLFSSVPKREYACQNITLSFGRIQSPTVTNDDFERSTKQYTAGSNRNENGVTLLVGRSASGKSTVLRLIAGIESPKEGKVFINGQASPSSPSVAAMDNNPRGVLQSMPSWLKVGLSLPPMVSSKEDNSKKESSLSSNLSVQPVILEGKPDFDDSLSVMERIVQVGREAVNQNTIRWTNTKSSINEHIKDSNLLIQRLAQDFVTILELSKEQCHSPPSCLSPSGQYSFGIACGCMISVAPAAAYLQMSSDNSCNIPHYSHDSLSAYLYHNLPIPYPIILLDELFDAEHPSTVEKLNRGILNLIGHGAVVISATHRPGYYTGMASRVVTLSGGKVLMEERLDRWARASCIGGGILSVTRGATYIQRSRFGAAPSYIHHRSKYSPACSSDSFCLNLDNW